MLQAREQNRAFVGSQYHELRVVDLDDRSRHIWERPGLSGKDHLPDCINRRAWPNNQVAVADCERVVHLDIFTVGGASGN